MVDSLWQTDALVLGALVQAIEVDGQDFPDVHAVFAKLGIDEQAGRRSLGRLVEARMLNNVGGRRGDGGGNWVVTGITERGLRQSGAWPDSTSKLSQQIIVGLAAAADAEQRDDQRERLRGAANIDPDVLTDVLNTALGGPPIRE